MRNTKVFLSSEYLHQTGIPVQNEEGSEWCLRLENGGYFPQLSPS